MKVPLIDFLINGKLSQKCTLTRRRIFIFVAVLTTLERMQISDDSLPILWDKSSEWRNRGRSSFAAQGRNQNRFPILG